MGEIAQMFGDNPLASAFGLLGLFCQIVWPLFRARKSMLTAQFGIGADYCVHYALLGAWSGAGVTALGATQTVIAYLAGERPWLRRLGLVCLPVLGVVCLLTWNGPTTLLIITGCAFIMLGRLQRDTLHMRFLLLCAAPFGIGYDLSVGAVPALIGAVISALIATVMFARELHRRFGHGHGTGGAVALGA